MNLEGKNIVVTGGANGVGKAVGLWLAKAGASCAIIDLDADAAATALFFDGGPELAARWGVEWVRMTTDGRVEWSPAVRAELFM